MPLKRRLYELMIAKGLATNRSQVETLVKLGKVRVNRHIASSPNNTVDEKDNLEIVGDRYVSRAAYKLASVTGKLKLDFKDKVVLDVGSSTGGFTDFALQHGASRVIAVDVGTDQMVPRIRQDSRVELHEKTDIRNVKKENEEREMEKGQNSHSSFVILHSIPDVVLVDVSFISLRQILPCIARIMSPETYLVAMAKPQFEVGAQTKHKGVIKNNTIRRNTLKELEIWIQKLFKIVDKADSEIPGEKGNVERFYLLTKLELIRK